VGAAGAKLDAKFLDVIDRALQFGRAGQEPILRRKMGVAATYLGAQEKLLRVSSGLLA
jgi:hypothetical protein